MIIDEGKLQNELKDAGKIYGIYIKCWAMFCKKEYQGDLWFLLQISLT